MDPQVGKGAVLVGFLHLGLHSRAFLLGLRTEKLGDVCLWEWGLGSQLVPRERNGLADRAEEWGRHTLFFPLPTQSHPTRVPGAASGPQVQLRPSVCGRGNLYLPHPPVFLGAWVGHTFSL